LTSILQRYEARVASGAIERDPAQVAAIKAFDALAGQLRERALARKGSALGWLFSKSQPVEAPKGLYIWGSVGRGKTMLMDLFYDFVQGPTKRRVHFHGFMADVHERIHLFRQKVKRGEIKDSDPIPHVAEALAREATLLCFDEFTVTDITDAMILGRLFTVLFAKGVVVVCTSNVEPSRLYENGLNRALFLPFITLLQQRMALVRLDARTDFRLEKLSGAEVFHAPANGHATEALDQAFARLTGGLPAKPITLTVKGHALHVPAAAAGVARFRFSELCEVPLGATDYLALAKKFHSIVIDAIPVMGPDKRNEAKRFINLIDALYDNHVKLIASAEAEAPALYTATEGREAFEFDRTVSRLIDMRSMDYLAKPHGRPAVATGNSTGIVET
jgi:cell division protein ZapE